MKNLIINADDFGLSKVFNDSILGLLKDGYITSTTVMVNRISPNQSEQVLSLKECWNKSDISVGMHTEFTYDQYVEQIENQYNKFLRLFDRTPTHLDIHKEHLYTSHHHHVAKFCKDKGIPFRHHGEVFEGVKTPYSKYFYGSIPQFDKIEQWLTSLPKDMINELVFHPGRFDPDCASSLNRDRETDLEHIKNIQANLSRLELRLCNFTDL